jgi:hypothetical protein
VEQVVRTRIFLFHCLPLMAIAACILCGCSGGVDPETAVAQSNSTNLQRVANLYLAYQNENGWVGPPDEATFKKYISGFPTKMLARIDVDPNNMDGLFTSERDGQPFKIRYKVVGNMMGSAEPVVFESVGVDGKRMVGTLGMVQMEVDSAEYDSLFAKGSAGAAQ